jgi:predicted transglutaminase-like cysteine proteinase
MPRTFNILAAVSLAVTTCWPSYVDAAYFGFPRGVTPHVDRMRLDAPSLAPMAHTRFCLEYPEECEVRPMAFSHAGRLLRRAHVAMTQARWSDLVNVNLDVNRSIVPEANDLGVLGDRWAVAPPAGDCNDYAVTKRHALLARGWPSRSLLLAEVVMAGGEHHLVLVVRTSRGDFVLDNLSPTIRPWSQAPYRWVRIQSPADPKFWRTIAAVGA